MPNIGSLEGALEWEHTKLMQLLYDANEETDRKIADKERELAQRGMQHSGMAWNALALLSAERAERIAMGMIEFRRQTARTFPELASPDKLTRLRGDIFRK